VRGDSAAFAAAPAGFVAPLQALSTCLNFVGQPLAADVVHCHTWYTHFGGILAKLFYALPLVITVHSLEPLRPWKREQLGRGYEVSAWLEKAALEMADALIAVSRSTADDLTHLFAVDPAVVTVIPNGMVAYLLLADNISGPLSIRLCRANQPVVSTRNALSPFLPSLLADI